MQSPNDEFMCLGKEAFHMVTCEISNSPLTILRQKFYLFFFAGLFIFPQIQSNIINIIELLMIKSAQCVLHGKNSKN